MRRLRQKLERRSPEPRERLQFEEAPARFAREFEQLGDPLEEFEELGTGFQWEGLLARPASRVEELSRTPEGSLWDSAQRHLRRAEGKLPAGAADWRALRRALGQHHARIPRPEHKDPALLALALLATRDGRGPVTPESLRRAASLGRSPAEVLGYARMWARVLRGAGHPKAKKRA